MKTGKSFLGTATLAILTVSLMLPLLANAASPETLTAPDVTTYRNKWQWIKTDTINILFPAGGEKPMFLWWYANDTSNVHVVKYKGLIEFLTFDHPYYRRTYEATALTMQAMLSERYFEPGQYRLQEMVRNRIRERIMYLALEYGLHSPYLPFNACTWNLTGPVEVTRGDVQYLSFNFTLVEVPFPNLQFAEHNVIIQCRFYYTAATEDVEGLYTYDVGAGELKMDLIVKNWTWNIDLIQPLLDELADSGIDVPVKKAGLALWINLCSISMDQIALVEEDVETSDGHVETASRTQNMYVEGVQVGVAENKTMAGAMEQPLTAQARLRERHRLRFQVHNATVAGYFKFVPQAIIRDGDNATVVDVTASYISAGSHLRLFLAYPYFGDRTLEHDPSLGLDSLPTLVTPGLLLVVIGVASVIAVAVVAVRWKRRTVNIVGAR